ncbi:MAG TPA: carboxypeptidase-like regulatory domain-containing protein [Kofleriaceae bacterium]|nr:carboxypeptidase-like regulatory domain-containing protein [Kofleriaceae bacterium]
MTPTPPPPRSRWPWVLAGAVALLALWRLESGGSPKKSVDDHPGLAGKGWRGGGASGGGGGGSGFLPGLRLRSGKHPDGPPRIPGLIRVEGKVVDADTGAPVGDVEVVFADGQSEASATSDLGGHYSIDVPAGRYRPFVRADGMMSVGRPERERLPARPRADQVAASTLTLAPELAVFHDLAGADLEVVRSAIIRGRVFDKAGHPIAGAVVRARPMDDEAGQPVLGTDVAETDLDGTFQLEVEAKPHQLEAFHDDYGATEEKPIVDLDPGTTRDVDLTMIAGCIIAGRIVGDGFPGGDGAIERAWTADDPSAFAPAGSFTPDGLFRWTTDEESSVTLRAWPWKSPPSKPQTFDCHDGARYDDVVFEIPHVPADLAGTVVTAGGAPAAGAYIDVTGVSPGTMNQQERADGNGEWEVFSLPPGDYAVTVRVPGQGVATARLTAPSRGAVLTLSGTGSMVGSAKGLTDGTFAVEVDCSTDSPSYGETGERFMASVHGGTYRIDGLPACNASMVARNGAQRTRRFDVEIPAGGVVTMDLDLAAPVTKEVTGVVRDPQGQPVDGAVVVVMDDPSQTRSESGADGRFTIEAKSGATLVVAGPGGAAELEVPDDDAKAWNVDVNLVPELDEE